MSRNHAKLVREGDRVRILDLKSANGVLVNDEEVEQAVLQSGDVVELGRVRMRFVPVGERFAVAPDEIERARIADAAGDDFDSDAGTGITNPVRPKKAQISNGDLALPTQAKLGLRKVPLPVLAGAGVLFLLLVVIVALLARGGDDDVPAVRPVTPNGTQVAVLDPRPPVEPELPVDPALTVPAVVTPLPADPVAVDPAVAPPPGVDPGAAALPADRVPAVDPAAAPADPIDPAGVDRSQDPDRTKKPPAEVKKPKIDVEASIKEARTLYLNGKHEKAFDVIRPVTKADKNNPVAWRLLGMAAQKLGRLTTMCTAYGELLRLQPNGADAEQMRANRKTANCK